jgi:glucose-1-phosphate cytidylyltransferase
MQVGILDQKELLMRSDLSQTSCVILAGGLGSRLSEETGTRPKPLVEIGGRPILWHIMKIFSQYGVKNFVICCGYKGYMIKEYFANYFLHESNVTIEMGKPTIFHEVNAEPWRVSVVDTGEHSMTGGRIRRIRDYIPQDRPFFMTYGDGLSDVDIGALYDFHSAHGKKATVTAVRPLARFGALDLHGTNVRAFKEKPSSEGGYINGGFFVLSPSVIDYIQGDTTVWEQEPLEQIARENNLEAFMHEGFWQPMDTLRDKQQLEDLWVSGKARWKLW